MGHALSLVLHSHVSPGHDITCRAQSAQLKAALFSDHRRPTGIQNRVLVGLPRSDIVCLRRGHHDLIVSL